MRPLQTLRHSLHGSSSHRITGPKSVEPASQTGPCQAASRHDVQVLTGRIVPADPYQVWLEEREADRERESHRLNPHAAWDDLRSQSFCAVGRG